MTFFKINLTLIALAFLVPCSGQEQAKSDGSTLQNKTLLGLDEGKDLKVGTYGVYYDPSTYTELKINKNHTFEYVDRGFTGIGQHCVGKWEVNEDNLVLFDYDERKNSLVPTKWKINENKLCNIPKKNGPKGVCITFKN